MNKIQVILDTQTDVLEFVNIANTIQEDVFLEDSSLFRANAKSILGVMYGMSEFKELHVLSDCSNLSSKFRKFMRD